MIVCLRPICQIKQKYEYIESLRNTQPLRDWKGFFCLSFLTSHPSQKTSCTGFYLCASPEGYQKNSKSLAYVAQQNRCTNIFRQNKAPCNLKKLFLSASYVNFHSIQNPQRNVFSVNETISGENETFKHVRVSVNRNE